VLRPFLKRFLIWLLLSLPVGAIAGGVVTWSQTIPGDFFRTTYIVGGIARGVYAASFGAFMAAITTTLGRHALRRASGSELLTGIIISYVTIGFGIWLFRTY